VLLREQPEADPRPGKRIEADPQLADELAVCRQYQISFSHFKGGDRRWTDDDQDLAIAYERYLRKKCPSCKTVPTDWIDSETRMPLEEPRWEAVLESCPGCAEIESIKEFSPKTRRGVYVAIEAFDPDRPDPLHQHEGL
jgi:hypothetical protein